MIHVIVREHALLTTAATAGTLDCAGVTQSAFDYLVRLSAGFRKRGATLVQLESGTALRLDNYVGVIETPCGTVLEVLPKQVSAPFSEQDSRRLLVKMLGMVLGAPTRDAGEADLQLLRRPLTEWVMRQFVVALDRLVKRGIRSDYLRVEEEQRFLRGQLDLARQLRQPPGRQHWFRIRHDIYSPNRPENRLLKLAVGRVRISTRDAATWRLANELEVLLSDVPASREPDADFGAWRDDRLMAHYADVRRWCELVLGAHMPIAQAGVQRGISLLFPMERLFEDYLACRLRQQLPREVWMTRHAAGEYLCKHEQGRMFLLQPDILMTGHGGKRWVLDAKWKLLDSQNRADKYGLSQADLYQLHAYGHRYLGGQGELFLVYPRTPSFAAELSPFQYSDDLRLRVIPFDLEKDSFAADTLPFLAANAAEAV